MVQALQVTFFLVLAASSIQQGISETVDWNFTAEMLRSYLCTGNEDWYKKISRDPMLKFIIHAQIEIYCKSGQTRDLDSLNELVSEARYAVELQPTQRRIEVSQCLLSGVKDGYLAPIVCTPSKKFMKNLDTLTDWIIQNLFCNRQDRNIWLKGACIIGKRMMDKREEIRKTVSPYFCKRQRDRVKRQYDLKTVIEMFEGVACARTSSFKNEAEEEGWLHFPAYGFWCCITPLVDG